MMKKTFLLLFMLVFPMVMMGQRHSKGIGGIDVFGGFSPGKYAGWNAGTGYSHYMTSSDIFRITGEYTQYKRKIYTREFDIRNYTVDLEYLHTVVSNHNNLYVNLGMGVKGGYEDIGKAKDYLNSDGRESNIKSRFVVIPLVVGEVEFFTFAKTAFFLQAKENYSPMSDLRKWNTTIGIGIRQLIF